MLQADSASIREKRSLNHLFFHEAQRVFHDRLIDNDDKHFFNEILADISNRYFGEVSLFQ
ncbi:unnamed protein product [Protopolystoma xenopodis]|uniref:Dynein heavy chain 3 AAA+ lid domain-containing protein n=1 Tax=Protopolystoma xenopodis TaxID=117903 RepID=A0A3S5B6X1_9PLAT|nr:unnamed protein product [Protopolystoma xenopodis]